MSTSTLASRAADVSTESVLTWFRDTRPELRSDAELIEGLDERPLVFINETGRYIAIGEHVVPFLSLFDGTRTGAEIVADVTGDRDPELVLDRLADLGHALRQAGALTEPPVSVGGREGVTRFMRREHLLRLPLTRSIKDWLEPPAELLRRIPGRRLFMIWLLVAVVGFGAGATSLFTVGGTWQPPQQMWLLYPLMFVQIAFHELAHALVCQYLRVPVREAGVGLMLYIMPVGYVDRTDAYRVRDRGSRAFIALAGPMSDQVWFGVAGVVAMTHAGAELGHFAISYLILQLLLTVMNFNPLTPSDGYHAVSAMAGSVNFRGQALSYLAHLVLRVPLSRELEHVSAAKRRWFLVYAVACLAFVATLAWGMFTSITGLIGAFV